MMISYPFCRLCADTPDEQEAAWQRPRPRRARPSAVIERLSATVAPTARPSCSALLITVDALARSRGTALVRFAATLAGGASIV